MTTEAHIRSDEGLERGPRTKPAQWPERKAPIAGKLENFNPQNILERYLNGEEISEIADTLGVHPKALNYHLLKPEIREAWRQAQVAVSHAEYLEAKQVIKSSPDALSLARARDLARACQWDLERLENRLFGQKQEVRMEVDHRVTIEAAMADSARTLLSKVRNAALPQDGQVIDLPSDAVQHEDQSSE